MKLKFPASVVAYRPGRVDDERPRGELAEERDERVGLSGTVGEAGEDEERDGDADPSLGRELEARPHVRPPVRLGAVHDLVDLGASRGQADGHAVEAGVDRATERRRDGSVVQASAQQELSQEEVAVRDLRHASNH